MFRFRATATISTPARASSIGCRVRPAIHPVLPCRLMRCAGTVISLRTPTPLAIRSVRANGLHSRALRPPPSPTDAAPPTRGAHHFHHNVATEIVDSDSWFRGLLTQFAPYGLLFGSLMLYADVSEYFGWGEPEPEFETDGNGEPVERRQQRPRPEATWKSIGLWIWDHFPSASDN